MYVKAKKIYAVIPAYNEAQTIDGVLDSLPKKITVRKVVYRPIPLVVNDGSHDTTSMLVRRHKGVVLVEHLLNMGAGAATRTGITYARELGADYVITLDADGQHLAKDVERVVKEIVKNKNDFVIGSRLIETKGMPWYRILGNKGLSLFTFILFGVFVTDSQSGLKGLNKEAMEKISFHSNRYAFCSEMIWGAKKAKLRITEVPITAIYTDYSLQKGQSNWGVIQILNQLIKRRLVEIING